jgi:hypothetical protein
LRIEEIFAVLRGKMSILNLPEDAALVGVGMQEGVLAFLIKSKEFGETQQPWPVLDLVTLV